MSNNPLAVPAKSPPAFPTSPRLALSVVVPCFNEEASLPLLLARLEPVIRGSLDGHAEVIAIDDGSADRTWPVLLELAARHPFLISRRHEQNQGLPEAWRTGALAARSDVVCTLDADLQYRPEEIPRLYQTWIESGVDIVQGSRVREARPFDSRYLLSRGLNSLLNSLFRISLNDNKSGFLVCRRDQFLALSVPTPFDVRTAGQSFLGQLPLRVTASVAADICRALIRYRFREADDH